MKRIIIFLIILVSCTLISCNNDQNLKQKELELKQRELDLKEKELAMMANDKKEQTRATSSQKSSARKAKKELRYLFYANGGAIGYFDDGSITGCPKCDFCKTNIIAMFTKKPMGSYQVQSDGGLRTNDNEVIYPVASEGWPLIDYKWNEKVPQY